MDRCYKEAKDIIASHMNVLEACAEKLIRKEKIMREEFEALFDQPAEPVLPDDAIPEL